MNYPYTDAYLERVVEEAKENGYTTTIMGRRRYIPELKSPNAIMRAFGKRVAMNAPIQGSAADIMKLAMIKVYQRLSKELPEGRMVMQVHDEILVECPKEKVSVCKAILREEMESVASLSVPLTADVSCGTTWLDQN